MFLSIYVPAPASYAELTIAPKSGIVGVPSSDGKWVRAYFEGNLYGAENMQTWEEKLLHAADRLMQNYPTTAVRLFPADQLAEVGTYDGAAKRVVEITDQQALDGWLNDGS